MTANCSKNLGRQSTIAPTSRINTCLLARIVGNTAPIAGRSIPGSRPKRNKAAAIAAPEWPADTTASACFCLTKSIATLIEALGLRLMPLKGSSCISIVPSAGTISSWSKRVLDGRAASICLGSPTSITSTSNSSRARSAPITISAGALSPPMASIAIRARVVPIDESSRNLKDLTRCSSPN